MLRARHPWCVGLDEHPHRAGIQRPPPTPALTTVIAGAAPSALAATSGDTPAKPTRHHHLPGVLVELDRFDDDPMVDADHPRPYPLRLHPVAPRSLPSLDSRKAKPDNGVHPRMVNHSPTERDEEPEKC
jgi:hypothetical protein